MNQLESGIWDLLYLNYIHAKFIQPPPVPSDPPGNPVPRGDLGRPGYRIGFTKAVLSDDLTFVELNL